jgi:hypothetical protein
MRYLTIFLAVFVVLVFSFTFLHFNDDKTRFINANRIIEDTTGLHTSSYVLVSEELNAKFAGGTNYYDFLLLDNFSLEKFYKLLHKRSFSVTLEFEKQYPAERYIVYVKIEELKDVYIVIDKKLRKVLLQIVST